MDPTHLMIMEEDGVLPPVSGDALDFEYLFDYVSQSSFRHLFFKESR